MSVIVVSVGTSLLTNNSDRLNGSEEVINAFEENQIAVDNILIEMENGSLKRVEPANIIGLSDFTKKFIEIYFDEKGIRKNIANRAKGLDHLPAEISSLYLYYYDRDGKLRDEFQDRLTEGSESDFTEKDRVILLTTDTADAVYCAKMLKEMINRVSLFNTKCHVDDEIVVIKNLDVYEPKKWAYDPPGVSGSIPMASKGIENLITYFESNFSGDAGEGERTLIRTGGYKELSSLLMLIAVQFRFISLYFFERSFEFVRLYVENLPEETDLMSIIRDTTYRGI